MTATDVEVQVSPAPSIDVDVQFGDEPQIDVAVQIEPPTFTVMSVLPTGPRGPAGPAGADGMGAVDSVNGETGVVVLGAADIPFTPNGSIAATNVQAAIVEVRDEAGTSGAPDDATYLTTTAHAGLSAEVVVGATPGGELGGSWASPTVDTTHSGSSHASTQAAAEATAAAALSGHVAAADPHPGYLTPAEGNAAYDASGAASTVNSALSAHISDTSDAHDASAISILDTANDFTATEVEGALAELQTADEADEAALAAHLSDASDAHDASAVSFVPSGTIAATDVQAAIEEVAAEAGSGSGLPDPWTSNQTSGEVTAATDAPDITALEFPVPEGQEVAPFVITSDTDLGSTDLIRVRQSVAKGDSDLFTVDDSGEVDITLVDPAATALKVTEAQDGEATLVEMSGSMTDREGISEIMAIGATGLAGGDSTVTRFDGGLRFSLGSFGEVLAFDPVEGTTTLLAHTGQTDPLLNMKDEDGNDALTVGPHGETVIEGTADVTELTLKAAAGQTANPLNVVDENDDPLFQVDMSGRYARFFLHGSPGANALDPTTLEPGVTAMDVDNGGLFIVFLNPAGSVNEWAQLGGEIAGTVYHEGFNTGNGVAVLGKTLPGNDRSVTISDVDGYNGSGNGFHWCTSGTDGDQFGIVRTGPVGSPKNVVFGGSSGPGGLAVNGDLDMSSGGVVYFTGSPGRVFFGQKTLPADGDMNNSTFTFALDDTPGATTLRVKAKDSAGTVRTATVPLS